MDNDFLQDPGMIQDFLVESEELLQGMDQDMVTLESTPKDADLLNRIFRALHTIKGTSGFLGFDAVVRLSHRAEDVLNALRRGEIELSQRMMDALLSARDQLGKMLNDIRQGGLKEYVIDGLIAELEAVQKPGEAPLRVGEILVAQGSIAPTTLDGVLQEQAASSTSGKLGEILVKEGAVSPAEVGNALVNQKQAVTGDTAAQTMRVDVRKLDELINLIGELVLERNRLMQLSRDLSAARLNMQDLDSALGQSTARLSFITEELQSSGLKTRMVPIDAVFRKFPRLVRDVAHSLQKEVELQVRGQDTEIDKTMVELIGDPLVHLVRNSLDHGIEMPDSRVTAGKTRQGTIRLEARQEGDQIVISIADDGAGIDPERILRKAIEKDLVTPERGRQLSQREILDFIFLPGFSTAEKVNNLSGRGVGMDVVRSNLKRMNGTIQLDTVTGKGTTILLRLPLTLAILPVLLVKVADEAYALPLRSVLETSRMRTDQVHEVEGNEVLRLRGETLPLLRLKKMFSTAPLPGKTADEKVVILAVGEKRIALLVDHLIGQESTVVKPLSSYLHHGSNFAGATLGGDGRVRLVLDPAGLLASAEAAATQVVIQ
ncbi:MAG TPA: chemotaxis protein CheA [Terriglobales bacterium]|nr:chemotaxis protein CheA [Terriglobales bacterium]